MLVCIRLAGEAPRDSLLSKAYWMVQAARVTTHRLRVIFCHHVGARIMQYLYRIQSCLVVFQSLQVELAFLATGQVSSVACW